MQVKKLWGNNLEVFEAGSFGKHQQNIYFSLNISWVFFFFLLFEQFIAAANTDMDVQKHTKVNFA